MPYEIWMPGGQNTLPGDKQIPVVARMRMEERAQLADLNNLYVISSQGTGRVPLGQVSSDSVPLAGRASRLLAIMGNAHRTL